MIQAYAMFWALPREDEAGLDAGEVAMDVARDVAVRTVGKVAQSDEASRRPPWGC